MKHKLKGIREYCIASLAMSMVAIIWITCIDAICFGTWRVFKVICSVTVFTFVLYLAETLIKNYLEKYFITSVLLEFILVTTLFFGFGSIFSWYPEEKWYWFLIYAIPIYIISYLLRLFGIHRNAEIINKHLEARKHRM